MRRVVPIPLLLAAVAVGWPGEPRAEPPPAAAAADEPRLEVPDERPSAGPVEPDAVEPDLSGEPRAEPFWDEGTAAEPGSGRSDGAGEEPASPPLEPTPGAASEIAEEGSPAPLPEHDHPPGPVLRYGGVELRPDLVLYLTYQLDLSADDLASWFAVTRGYLGAKVRLASWLGARLTFDVRQTTDLGRAGAAPVDDGSGEAEVGASRFNGSLAARLKYAYLELGLARLSASVRFGLVHTPWIGWMEHIELGRVFRVIMAEELFRYPSADFGLVLVGHVTEHLSYHLGIVNGEGYHGVESTRFKDLVGRVSLRPFPRQRGLEALQLSGYFQLEVPVPGADEEETARRFGGGLTYRLVDEVLSPDGARVRGERLALWVQAFYGQQGPRDATTELLGLSFGARVELPYRLFVLARADRYDLDMGSEQDDYWRLLAAFGIRPHPALAVGLDYQGRIGAGEEHLLGIHAELSI